MAPKRKQTPRNGFFYFMTELKNRGGSKYGSLKEAADAAGPLWDKMSAKEREPFNQQALMTRNTVRGGKLTCDGYEVEEVEREQDQEQTRVQEMKNDINLNLKLSRKRNCIQEEMFFIVHINIFCHCPSTNLYIPAEIAVAAFNLEEGVLPERVFHRIIQPGDLPLGFAHDAMLHSNGTHQLPPPISDGNMDNMEIVFTELKKFLSRFNPGKNGYHVLYAEEKRSKMVRQVLDQWCYAYGEEKPLFKVYDLEYMFQVLRNTVGDDNQVWPSDTYSSREIEKDVYAYATNISCQFHEVSNASTHCSRSKAVRYAFIICDNCCGDLDINLLAGQHIPQNFGFGSARSKSVASTSNFASTAPSEIDEDARSMISVSSRKSWGTFSMNSQSTAFTLDNDSTFPKLGSERSHQTRGRDPPYERYFDADTDTSSQRSFASALGSSSTRNNDMNAFVSDFRRVDINNEEGPVDEFPSIGHGKGKGVRKNANSATSMKGVPSAARGRRDGN